MNVTPELVTGLRRSIKRMPKDSGKLRRLKNEKSPYQTSDEKLMPKKLSAVDLDQGTNGYAADLGQLGHARLPMCHEAMLPIFPNSWVCRPGATLILSLHGS